MGVGWSVCWPAMAGSLVSVPGAPVSAYPGGFWRAESSMTHPKVGNNY